MKKHTVIKDIEPVVSIIVPCYNSERFVGQTLDSLVKQTVRDIEILVVNDASTDNSENVIKQFFYDRRIKYIKHDENKGTGGALNTGHERARGQFITWASADNLYFPNFVETLAGALGQCQWQGLPIQFVYSDFTYIDESNRRIQDVIHQQPQPREDLVNGYDLGMSFMYTAELWRATGPFWNRICEDFEWATRAAQYTNFGLIKAILAAFRVHGGQITGSRKEEEAASAEHCRNQAREMLAQGKYGSL